MMESLIRYVEAETELKEAKKELYKELSNVLGLNDNNIKEMYIYNREKGSKLVRILSIHLRGTNKFTSEDIGKIEGLTITSNNRIELECGEIYL